MAQRAIRKRDAKARSFGPTLIVVLILATALAMLLPAAVGFSLREHELARPFLYSAGLLASIAALTHLATRAGLRGRRSALSHPFPILTLSFLLLPALMAIPMTEALPGMRFLDAWFEMLAAFTTTGASLLEGEVGRSLDLWRATVAWGGGLFTLVTITALLVPLNLGGAELFRGQIGGSVRLLHPGLDYTLQEEDADAKALQRLREQVRVILPAYLALTLGLWVALSILGNPPLIALMLAMSTMATSGIIPSGTEFSVPSEVLIACFLILALSRRLWPGAGVFHQHGLRKRNDPELLLALGILGLVVSVTALDAFLGPQARFADHLAHIWAHGFTSLSFLTTTGFISTASGGLETVFPGPSGMVLLGLALFGGGVATTAGGLKLMRVFSLGWQAQREVAKLLHPDSVGGDGPRLRSLRREGAFLAWLFLMVFILSLTTLTASLTVAGLSLEDAVIFATAALTTTGPLVQIAASEPLAWSALGSAAKAILAFGMVLGRLELLLLLSILWRRLG